MATIGLFALGGLVLATNTPYKVICHHNPGNDVTLSFQNEQSYSGHLNQPHNDSTYDSDGPCATPSPTASPTSTPTASPTSTPTDTPVSECADCDTPVPTATPPVCPESYHLNLQGTTCIQFSQPGVENPPLFAGEDKEFGPRK